MYVPAVSDPSVADTCRVCGAVPLVGLTDSQAESLLAVKFSVPCPVLVRLTLEGEGFVPLPWVAAKLSVVVERVRTGGGDVTLKVTVMVAGEFSAPAAVTVT